MLRRLGARSRLEPWINWVSSDSSERDQSFQIGWLCAAQGIQIGAAFVYGR
jgi:hypothetical protein